MNQRERETANLVTALHQLHVACREANMPIKSIEFEDWASGVAIGRHMLRQAPTSPVRRLLGFEIKYTNDVRGQND